MNKPYFNVFWCKNTLKYGRALGINPPPHKFWVQKQRKEDASLVLMTPSAGEQEAKLTPVGPITILGQLFSLSIDL